MATLSNDQQGGIDFVTTFDGKLVQRVPEGTDGAMPRQLTKGANEGKTVWEKTYTSVSGMITDGGVEVKEFGGKKVKEIQLKLDDDTLLQLPMNLLSAFAKPLPNVDTSKPVKVSVYKNKRGKVGLNLSFTDDPDWRKKIENDEYVEWVNYDWAYTRENPGDLPQPVQDELGEWDFRDHDKFLELEVRKFFADGFAPDPVAVVQEALGGTVVEDDTDIPF